MIPHPKDVKSSAPLLLTGQVLALLGYVVIVLGSRTAYQEALSRWGDPDAGLGWIAFGAFLVLVSLILTTVGSYQFASNADTAARGSAISVQMLERLSGQVDALHALKFATGAPANLGQGVETFAASTRQERVTDAPVGSEPGQATPKVPVAPRSKLVAPDASVGDALAKLSALYADGTITAEQYAIEKTLEIRAWTSRG